LSTQQQQQLCREEALDLEGLFLASNDSESKDYKLLDGFGLMGVIKETAPTSQCSDDKCLGVSQFLRQYFPSSGDNVLLDTEHTFYDALGGRTLTGQLSSLGWFSVFNPFKIWAAYGDAKKRLANKGGE
jgi:hypothetical protein